MNSQALHKEKLRVQALRELEVLDTLPEPVFDEIVRIASEVCGTPIALISLVDEERQWFKARVGFKAAETPRRVSFCAHAILEHKPFIIEDAAIDPRFTHNPLVTAAPHIKFYAGIPLEIGDGHRIGTLCVIDTKARSLENHQVRLLEILADRIVCELRLRSVTKKAEDLESEVERLRLENERAQIEKEAAQRISLRNNEFAKLHRGLELSEARYKTLCDASPLGIFSTTSDGSCVYVNQKYLEISGLSSEACLGSGWSTAIHPEDRERVFSEWHAAASSASVYESIHRFLRPDGSIAYCKVKAAAIVGKTDVVGYVGVVEDITMGQRVERRLKLATSTAKIGVWEWDILTNILTWDNSMLEIYGIKEEEFLGAYDTWAQAVSVEDRPGVEALLWDAVKGTAEYNTTFQINLPDGGIRFIKATGAVERDQNGIAQRMVGTNSDVTEQQLHAAELEKLRRMAESATRAKSEFLAHMSHEIRTPMNGVLGISEVLLDCDLPKDQYDMVRDINTSAESLLTIINDILDMSKIEAGKIDIHPVHFELDQVIDDVLVLLRPKSDEKLISLIYSKTPEVPKFVFGDDVRIRQIVMNLVGNAIKFTDVQGAVVIRIEAEVSENDQCLLKFAVSDTGIGISEENAKKLFEPFVQAENSTTRRFGGTGLGLAISRKLVELMGGEIWVSSKENLGSVFHFTLRTRIGTKLTADLNLTNQPIDDHCHGSAQTTVLLVEDNLINQKLATRLVEKRGVKVVIANDGVEALEKISNSPETFSAVLMDCQMPRLDGYDTTKRIRELEAGTGRHLPIIAMTASAMEGDKENCFKAGMDAYLSKPISKQDLFSVLGRFIDSNSECVI